MINGSFLTVQLPLAEKKNFSYSNVYIFYIAYTYDTLPPTFNTTQLPESYHRLIQHLATGRRTFDADGQGLERWRLYRAFESNPVYGEYRLRMVESQALLRRRTQGIEEESMDESTDESE